MNHEELQKTWKPTDYWQYCNKENVCNGWRDCPLGKEPIWATSFLYRIHPHNEAMKAFDAGEEIEWNDGSVGFSWKKITNPSWFENRQYRIKPKKEPEIYDLVVVWDDDIEEAYIRKLKLIVETDIYPVKTNNGVFKNYLTPTQWAKKVEKLK